MADIPHSQPLSLDAVRRCMLMAPIAADLDVVTTAEPVNRCMIVAKVLHEAGQEDEAVMAEVQSRGVLEALRSEAILRKTGQRVVCAPLATTGRAEATKERARV